MNVVLRLLKSFFRKTASQQSLQRRLRLYFDCLEARLAPANYFWTPDAKFDGKRRVPVFDGWQLERFA